jgi:hypothetical protein
MTVTEVRERIDHIKAIAADDEAAHSAEDALRADVLHAIANDRLSDVEAMQCAALALSTSQIDFARWCA